MMGAHGQYRELSSQPHLIKLNTTFVFAKQRLLVTGHPGYCCSLSTETFLYMESGGIQSHLFRKPQPHLSNFQITYASFIPIFHSFSPVSELALPLNMPCWLKSPSCFSNLNLSYCFNYLPLFLGEPPSHYWISLTQTSGTVWLPVLPIVDTSSLPPDCKQALVINMELLW